MFIITPSWDGVMLSFLGSVSRLARVNYFDHRVSKRGTRVRTLQLPSLEFEKEV